MFCSIIRLVFVFIIWNWNDHTQFVGFFICLWFWPSMYRYSGIIHPSIQFSILIHFFLVHPSICPLILMSIYLWLIYLMVWVIGATVAQNVGSCPAVSNRVLSILVVDLWQDTSPTCLRSFAFVIVPQGRCGWNAVCLSVVWRTLWYNLTNLYFNQMRKKLNKTNDWFLIT